MKQAKCVHKVTLIDKSSDMEKFFWTTFTKVNFPLHFKKDICSLVIRLDYLQEQYFLVKAKTKCKDNNDIPFDTICDNSTKAMEVKKGTSSILVIFVSMLGGLIIPAGILVNVLVCFCSQCHQEGSFLLIPVFSLLKSLENVVCS